MTFYNINFLISKTVFNFVQQKRQKSSNCHK
jgi:hypothetical protein